VDTDAVIQLEIAVAAMLLLVAILLLWDASNRFLSSTAAAVVAVLALLTRPVNAFGFGAVYLAAIFIAISGGKDRRAHILRTACFTSIAVTSLALISPLKTIARQIKEYVNIFGVARPIQFSFVDQQLDFLRSEWLWPVSALACAFVLVLQSDRRPNRIAALLCTIGMFVTIAVIWRTVPYRHPSWIGTSAGMLAFLALSIASLNRLAEFRVFAMLWVSALIPWMATLGSANATSIQLAFYAGLSCTVALAAVTLIARNHALAIPVAAIVGLYLTFSAVQSGLAAPYRLAAPVGSQVVPTELGQAVELKLDGKTSAFVRALRKAANQGGFCYGDIAVDLSGSLPGAVFAIGGQMPVFPWILGGYPFSDRLAQRYLKILDPKRFDRSWLITGETPGSFSMQTWQSIGIDFLAHRLVDDLPHPVDGTSVKLYAPLQPRGAKPCAQ
jgi:hypothetical protein